MPRAQHAIPHGVRDSARGADVVDRVKVVFMSFLHQRSVFKVNAERSAVKRVTRAAVHSPKMQSN